MWLQSACRQYVVGRIHVHLQPKILLFISCINDAKQQWMWSARKPICALLKLLTRGRSTRQGLFLCYAPPAGFRWLLRWCISNRWNRDCAVKTNWCWWYDITKRCRKIRLFVNLVLKSFRNGYKRIFYHQSCTMRWKDKLNEYDLLWKKYMCSRVLCWGHVVAHELGTECSFVIKYLTTRQAILCHVV